MDQLRARRHNLLVRCAEQRVELGELTAQLRAGFSFWPARGAASAEDGAGGGSARTPLLWLGLLAGLLLFKRRTRTALSAFLFVRSALGLASRAAQILRLIGVVRASARAARRSTPRDAVAPAGHSAHGR
jgi:hypothetical protein